MRIVSDRYRTAENSLLTKHVVAAGLFAKDAGSTPAASTIFYGTFSEVLDFWGQFGDNFAHEREAIPTRQETPRSQTR